MSRAHEMAIRISKANPAAGNLAQNSLLPENNKEY